VLFADDTNILVSGKNVVKLQYKINNVMTELQMWFKLNNLVVNAEKMMAMSFHTLQNKRPVSPHITFEGRNIQYNMETKLLGIYINENMKWNSHVKYLSSKLSTSYYMINSLRGVTSLHILRNTYFAHFHVHLKYGLTLWGSEPESRMIFKLQKKVIRIISNAG
jgi:hypothetical protein